MPVSNSGCAYMFWGSKTPESMQWRILFWAPMTQTCQMGRECTHSPRLLRRIVFGAHISLRNGSFESPRPVFGVPFLTLDGPWYGWV